MIQGARAQVRVPFFCADIGVNKTPFRCRAKLAHLANWFSGLFDIGGKLNCFEIEGASFGLVPSRKREIVVGDGQTILQVGFTAIASVFGGA